MLRPLNVISKWICGWHYTLQNDLSHKWSFCCHSSLSNIILPALSTLKWTKVLTISLVSSQSGHKFPYFTVSEGKHLYTFPEGGQKLLPSLLSTHLNTSCCCGGYLRPTAKLMRNVNIWKRISMHSILLGLLFFILLRELSLLSLPQHPLINRQ